MSISSLSEVLKIFGGAEPTAEELEQLAEEVMLMVLARATAADSNIAGVEIDTVRAMIRERLGKDLEDAEIRIAANSAIYEKQPLQKYVASAAKKLPREDRVGILDALAAVIRADDKVGAREIDFYNEVAGAMAVTYADVIGLVEG